VTRWKKRPRRYVVKPWYPRHSFSSVSRQCPLFGGLFSKQSPGFLNMSPSCRNFLLFTSLKSVAVIHAFFNTQPLVFLAVHDTLNICWNPFISKAYIVRAAHLPSWWLSFHSHVATGIIKLLRTEFSLRYEYCDFFRIFFRDEQTPYPLLSLYRISVMQSSSSVLSGPKRENLSTFSTASLSIKILQCRPSVAVVFVLSALNCTLYFLLSWFLHG